MSLTCTHGTDGPLPVPSRRRFSRAYVIHCPPLLLPGLSAWRPAASSKIIPRISRAASDWPLRPELAAPLDVWPSSQLAQRAAGRGRWWLEGVVAVLLCCMPSWRPTPVRPITCRSGAGVYLADLDRQRRNARQWRKRIADSRLGVFLRLEDDDGHADAVNRCQPVRTDKTGRPGHQVQSQASQRLASHLRRRAPAPRTRPRDRHVDRHDEILDGFAPAPQQPAQAAGARA